MYGGLGGCVRSASTAVTWPIGNGLTFEGIYDRLENKVYLYKQKDGVIELGANGVFGDALEGVISDANLISCVARWSF